MGGEREREGLDDFLGMRKRKEKERKEKEKESRIIGSEATKERGKRENKNQKIKEVYWYGFCFEEQKSLDFDVGSRVPNT